MCGGCRLCLREDCPTELNTLTLTKGGSTSLYQLVVRYMKNGALKETDMIEEQGRNRGGSDWVEGGGRGVGQST